MARMRTKQKPRFEKRVWQVFPYDWRWELRERDGGIEAVQTGRASGPIDANQQIRAFITRVEKRERAQWRPVRG